MRKIVSGLVCSLLLAIASTLALAQNNPKVAIVVFGQPSLGGFLQPIIKARKFDAKNGIEINFVERTPDAYIAQFNSGEWPIFAGHAHGLTFASQISKVETLRSELTFGQILRGLQVYGYQVVDGKALVQAQVTPAS